ncbi:alpha/beta hydrolase [Altererythrobacter sp. CC-YST694]|uniref:alpha/beta hydrolase n=1 Tax=Altererythrobacter sp. CC-YST694 TaxID=2755038 RepID=UPI001D012B68|nr:alpha/beta hydrolase [Altererythrobacter sp. CC-YST694]MCB5426039.1 alpha/beta hydrolase [Altererythrobacter sp. CC-YST694]
MDRRTFHAELRAMGSEFTMELIERTNALLAPLVPAPDESGTTRDIAYGPHERHRFNLFRPAGSEPAPCLIFVHDGGFVMGDKGAPGAPFYNNIGAWAQQQGFACATMNYRLAPEVRWPAGRDDVIAMLLHLASHAAEYRIDPERIFLMGHSAGATHVADVVAAPSGAAGKFAGAIMSSGFYDLSIALRDPFKPQYYGAELEDWSPMSPLPGLLASRAPCLFALCELDMAECHDQAKALADAWYAARGQIPVLHVQSGHNHISGARQIGSPVDSFGPLIASFIRAF